MSNIIKVRRGTKASLPTLQAGELAFCTDTFELFAGTGSENKLIGPGSGGGLNEYVTANGIIIGNSSGNPASLAVAENRIVGRKTGGGVDDLTISEILDFIGSAAQGDLLYRGASAWARLSKGSANQKLFTNASANAPEWGTGIKVVCSTRSAQAAGGDVSYSGFGFKPSLLIAMAASAGSYGAWSIGASDGTDDGCILKQTASMTGSVELVNYLQSSGNQQYAYLKSFDSDGATLTWYKVGSPAAENIQLVFIGFR